MIFFENQSLKKLNTFGIDISAKYFAYCATVKEIQYLLDKETKYATMPKIILGEGSNILFTKNFDGLVLCPGIKGIEIINNKKNTVVVRVGAGENWDDFVNWSTQNNYQGLENLSYIPGSVGASPVQNIGAYGVEAKDYINKVHALEISSLKKHVFKNVDCQFNYRYSIFKDSLKDKMIITHVDFELSKMPNLKLDYGNLSEKLSGLSNPSPSDVRNAVIEIRKSKLPEPDEIGNAGSFFKNPVVPVEIYDKISLDFPKVPNYKVSDKLIKIPAGWLIEQTGMKGSREGDAGTHTQQALVMVNYGNATGQEILNFSEKVKTKVKNKFNIELETEVNIL